ncbi:VacJ family lipoprotein [Hahella aquimaris]|uniref:MlaA family lipoprotein n=1 Tax=Hahella sp. HNIBRBA332 TaxID=3015983 RepID=UPI00273CF32C|nr:VacJ family lipoprotein [Hahella sp. HNIBRBA332]WLQ16924.1 VacJ family lipoprotein [Hahella sp. HNIBRBA332]
MDTSKPQHTRRLSAVLLLSMAAPAGAMASHPQDPWESYNRKVFAFNEFLDDYFLRPVAKGYRAVTPEVVDRSITNFFGNLGDVVTLANNILQLKPRETAATASRIMFNSTWGVGGLFDVATAFDISVDKEDFGQTLSYWGVPQGNYLMLPFLGPGTITDTIGRIPDSYADPVGYLFPEPERYFASATRIVDKRADIIPAENLIQGDRYTFVRNAYLQQREFLINDGKVEDPFTSDDFDEDY